MQQIPIPEQMSRKYERVKVFVVSARHPGEVLVLEKHRDDLAGGHIERNEKRKKTAAREAREELPDANLRRFNRISPSSLRRVLGKAAVTDTAFYAACGDFPLDSDGNEMLSVTSEHSGAHWESRTQFLGSTAPPMYKVAAIAGEQIFRQLEREHALELGIILPQDEEALASA